MINNDNYNSVAKFLHWAIALLILTNYLLGITLDDAEYNLLNVHKQIGMTILLLVVIRVMWRLSSKYPPKLKEVSFIEDILAKCGQILLYFLMFLVPLSGVLLVQTKGYSLVYLNTIIIPTMVHTYPKHITHMIKELHEALAHTIIILAAGHVLIALYHHFIKKDRLLLRMLPFNKKHS